MGRGYVRGKSPLPPARACRHRPCARPESVLEADGEYVRHRRVCALAGALVRLPRRATRPGPVDYVGKVPEECASTLGRPQRKSRRARCASTTWMASAALRYLSAIDVDGGGRRRRQQYDGAASPGVIRRPADHRRVDRTPLARGSDSSVVVGYPTPAQVAGSCQTVVPRSGRRRRAAHEQIMGSSIDGRKRRARGCAKSNS